MKDKIDTNSMPYAIFTYVHHNRQVAAMVKLHCQTDFALRTDLIKSLGEKLAMQVAANNTLTPDDAWIHDSSKTVVQVLTDACNELKEFVVLGDIHLCR
jgi:translation elongation factor EF-Ts